MGIDKFEYIKCFWKYIDDETPVILFYEVDLENERYATRMTEVFVNRKAVPVMEPGFEFITEAPVPIIDEINRDNDFFAEVISREEFEEAYRCGIYSGDIGFPRAEIMMYIYFKKMPENCFLDEMEDDMSDLLDECGEVTGAGLGINGGNIDIEIYEECDVLQDIKSYLISRGFGADTVLDINGKREVLCR